MLIWRSYRIAGQIYVYIYIEKMTAVRKSYLHPVSKASHFFFYAVMFFINFKLLVLHSFCYEVMHYVLQNYGTCMTFCCLKKKKKNYTVLCIVAFQFFLSLGSYSPRKLTSEVDEAVELQIQFVIERFNGGFLFMNFICVILLLSLFFFFFEHGLTTFFPFSKHSTFSCLALGYGTVFVFIFLCLFLQKKFRYVRYCWHRHFISPSHVCIISQFLCFFLHLSTFHWHSSSLDHSTCKRLAKGQFQRHLSRV